MKQLIRDLRSGKRITAFESFWHRRHLGAVAWVIMAAFVAYNFALERDHSNTQSAALKQATYSTLIHTCEASNRLRRVLRGLILDPEAVAQDKRLVREGVISEDDLRRAIALAHKQQKRVAPRNCRKVYAVLAPPEGS